MSILYFSDKGWLISHADLINTFYASITTSTGLTNFKIKQGLFQITFPFKNTNTSKKKRKRKQGAVVDDHLLRDIDHIKTIYKDFKLEFVHLLTAVRNDYEDFNKCALDLSAQVYEDSGIAQISNIIGGNKDEAKFLLINNSKFLFPSNCRFFCKDIVELNDYLINEKYDCILLDPPWWNKYIRRKKAKTNFAYTMMFNADIKMLPIDKLLADSGLVVVWCTNSQQHLKALELEFFPEWNVQYVAKLFWLKITNYGQPVCKFSDPPGKQPFEQILVGIRKNSAKSLSSLNGKLIVSVPSALHSHKPPLTELLAPYLPDNPKCLEIFARYLQPNWTSWGLEVLRFQNECLYEADT